MAKQSSLIKRILTELATNGKSFLAWVLVQVPGLTDYPGLVSALEAFAAAPTRVNAINAGVQLFWALATGHRALKLIQAILSKANKF